MEKRESMSAAAVRPGRPPVRRSIGIAGATRAIARVTVVRVEMVAARRAALVLHAAVVAHDKRQQRGVACGMACGMASGMACGMACGMAHDARRIARGRPVRRGERGQDGARRARMVPTRARVGART